MPVALQYKKTGGSVARLTQTFLSGECFFDTDVDGWFVGDSMTPGGLQVANGHITSIAVATQTVNNGDAGKLFVYSNAAGCAVALAVPSGTYFPLQSGFWLLNNSTGNVVVTATGATINGGGTLTLFPDDSAVIVSDGANYFAIHARTGFSASTPVNIHVIGNTTGATSTSTVFITGSTVSAAGGFSAGFSAGQFIFSNPNVNATENDTALGNTTGLTSSTTQALGSSMLSGAGDLSIGMSGSTLILSAPAGATSTSGRNAVALGNTTGATSSSVLTLTQMSLQAGGGISIGYSTTAAAAGVVIISGDLPATSSVSTLNMVAIGNTTGSTSSQTAQILSQTYSAAGLLSGGFSNSTFVLSGSVAASAILSYFEPRPLLSASTSVGLNTASAIIAPFNRMKVLATYNFAAIFGPDLLVQTTTTSDTLTASCAAGYSLFGLVYSSVNMTQSTLTGSTSISSGFSCVATASRSSNSASVTASATYSAWSSTTISTITLSITATGSSAGQMSFGFFTGTNTLISASFSGIYEIIIPLATTMATGLNAVGLRASSTTQQGSSSTGVSWSAMPNAPVNPFYFVYAAIGNSNFRSTPQGAQAPMVQHPYGAGVTSSAAGAIPLSYNPVVMSQGGFGYGAPWFELSTGV
jgi:hypothetical protein